jgi:hypothetical protein
VTGRKHETPTKAKSDIDTTAAMAAGVADHVWKVAEIVALLDSQKLITAG